LKIAFVQTSGDEEVSENRVWQLPGYDDLDFMEINVQPKVAKGTNVRFPPEVVSGGNGAEGA